MVCQCQSKQKLHVEHEDMTKAYKFDLEVKGQHRMGNMNVHVTSSHGDRPMCQIWSANVKLKNSYGPDTNLHRQTDRQSDSFIPPELRSMGV